MNIDGTLDVHDSMKHHLGGLGDMVAMVGSSAPGSEVGVMSTVRAAIVPAAPDCAEVNLVTYRNTSFVAGHTQLREVFLNSGVRAWSVLVPSTDAKTKEALQSKGYTLMETQAAMMLDLSSPIELDGTLDFDADGDPIALGHIYEAALSFPEGSLSPAFAHKRKARTPTPIILRAWLGGRLVGVACAMPHVWPDGSDLGLSWIGVLPEVQGQGIDSRLVKAALDLGRKLGCVTATLRASREGEAMYRRLGFQEVGSFAVYHGHADS